MKRIVCLLLVSFLCVGMIIGGSQAESADFPTKTITLICPYEPGGGTDAMARKLAEIMEEQTGATIIVENRVGGSGAVGFGTGATAAPDGHTVTIATVELVLLPMAELAPYKVSDFRAVMRINFDALALISRKGTPYNNMEEMVKYAKENPEEIKMYLGSFPSPGWLAQNMLSEQAGIKFNSISGGSASAADDLQNLLGGHMDVTLMTLAEAAPYVETGDIKVIAVASDKRVTAFPEHPAFSEFGYNISVGTWRGPVVPKDTPDEIVNALEKMFTDAYNHEEFQEFMERMKFGTAYMTQQEFNTQLQREIDDFTPIVDKYRPR